MAPATFVTVGVTTVEVPTRVLVVGVTSVTVGVTAVVVTGIVEVVPGCKAVNSRQILFPGPSVKSTSKHNSPNSFTTSWFGPEPTGVVRRVRTLVVGSSWPIALS
jgi:hypothetical protein